MGTRIFEDGAVLVMVLYWSTVVRATLTCAPLWYKAIPIPTVKCDRVCKNQSYLHIKFDLILNLITLFLNIVLYQKFHHMHKLS